MRQRRWIGFTAMVLVMAVAVFSLVAVVNSNSKKVDSEQISILQNAIYRALVTCYAAEGFYPQSIAYLEDNYGISVDDTQFVVFYDGFASNILPSVRVVARGGEKIR